MAARLFTKKKPALSTATCSLLCPSVEAEPGSFMQISKSARAWRKAQNQLCVCGGDGISFSCPVVFPLQQSLLSPPDLLPHLSVLWRYHSGLGWAQDRPWHCWNGAWIPASHPQYFLPSQGEMYFLLPSEKDQSLNFLLDRRMCVSLDINDPVISGKQFSSWEPDPKSSCSGVCLLRLGFTCG